MKIVGYEGNAIADCLVSGRRPRYLMVMNEIGFLYCHFMGLANAIQEAGWEVVVAGRNAAGAQRAIDAGIEFIELPLKIGIGGPWTELRAALAMRAAIRCCDPDVVHLISLKNVLLGGLLTRGRKRTSTVGAITGLGTLFLDRRWIYSVYRPMVMQGLKRVFGNPRAVMALENNDDRAFFIENGVVSEERSFLIPGAGLERDALVPKVHVNDVPVVLCVSRMIRSKGILYLIDAARILRSKGTRFELLLVGDIDQHNPMSLTRHELRAAESDGFVKWMGQRSDVAELLNKADIFCLPTYYREGLPRSLVEASAAGLPIVTSDVPGCREVVTNGVNGLLVPPRDVEALADALCFLIGDQEMCRRMGAEARRRFEERFTKASVLAAFNQCYAALGLPLEVGCK
jgi:glycosyltransferase involved in cell wall biosynthesis